MKKVIYLIMLVFVLGGCKPQLKLMDISNNIYKRQIHMFGDTMLLKGLEVYRKNSNMMGKLRFSTVNDTVFALEQLGFQGDLSLTYWNNVDTVSYTNTAGEPEYVEYPLFSKYMMELVSQWNIVGIKEEEKVNSPLLPNEPVFATRIIIRKNKYKVECIRFDDFYNLKRD